MANRDFATFRVVCYGYVLLNRNWVVWARKDPDDDNHTRVQIGDKFTMSLDVLFEDFAKWLNAAPPHNALPHKLEGEDDDSQSSPNR